MKNRWNTKTKRVGIIIVATLLLAYLFLMTGLFSYSSRDKLQPKNILTGDTLYCTILIDNKLNPGNPTLKFATDLIRQFSINLHCIIEVSVEKSSVRNWEDLTDKLTDIIIFNFKTDSIPAAFKDYLCTSKAIEKDYVCAVRYDEELLIENINFWITHIQPSSEYKKLLAKLHKTENRRLYSLPMTRYSISAYDNLVKKYSATIGWDWRLLSALIYKESGFNNGVVSSMGAVGLMQVLQSVADAMGVEDIYDPEQNIRTGCKILGSVHKKYLASGMDEENALKFTLASYNAGEGRIQQCRKVAQAEGKNSMDWEEVASVIPLMAEGYDKNGVKVPPFRGSAQTLAYPKRVLEQYEIYKNTVEE